MLKKTKARIHFQICDGEPEMLAVVADRMAFGIGRLRLVPTSPLAFAVLAFDSGLRGLGHGVPFLQL